MSPLLSVREVGAEVSGAVAGTAGGVLSEGPGRMACLLDGLVVRPTQGAGQTSCRGGGQHAHLGFLGLHPGSPLLHGRATQPGTGQTPVPS